MTLNSEMPNSKRKVTLPGSIRDFVERQATLPLESLFEDTDTPFIPTASTGAGPSPQYSSRGGLRPRMMASPT